MLAEAVLAAAIAIGLGVLAVVVNVGVARTVCRRRAIDAVRVLGRVHSSTLVLIGLAAMGSATLMAAVLVVAPASLPAAVCVGAVAIAILAAEIVERRAGAGDVGRPRPGVVAAALVPAAVAALLLGGGAEGTTPSVRTYLLAGGLAAAAMLWWTWAREVDLAMVWDRRRRARQRSIVRAVRRVVEHDLEPVATSWADLAWWAATVTSPAPGPSCDRDSTPHRRPTADTVTVPGRRGQLRAVADADDAVTLVLVCPGGPISGVSARLPLPARHH